MDVDFKNSQNKFSCIYSGLKYRFGENLNKIGAVDFALLLGLLYIKTTAYIHTANLLTIILKIFGLRGH